MHRNPRSWRLLFSVTTLVCALLGDEPARAQNSGFAVNRYEPTAAGEWSFWVDHPWYSSTRYFAAGVTLNYGHNPLVFGTVSPNGSFMATRSVIEHQLLGHVDLAGSFLDRILITGSLPITFLERGNAIAGVSPANGVALGDPRFGIWGRLFGQPYKSAISMSLGVNVWVPLRSFGETTGVATTSSDQGVLRVMPKIALGGYAKKLMWSFTGAFQYRPAAQIGIGIDPAGSTVGSELQLGASIYYADMERRFAVGPEAIMGTALFGNDAVKPFTREFTSLEVLLGAHYNIARLINVGVAGGVGILRTPGTPDGRVLLRLAYAPFRDDRPKDRDRDGIPDVSDACPDQAGVATDEPNTHGCPDRDRDGVVDRLDQCPDTPRGKSPDPTRLGCPAGDRDGDGVIDPEDQCIDVPQSSMPDPNKRGCPSDKDGDGVIDADDKCIDVPQGGNPDPERKGCPLTDKDGDGVYDPKDQCIDVPQGLKPDPAKPGCPLPDRDKDTVVDPEDACPDQAGAPNPDPKKNGCPGLITVTNGQIQILQPVFFATNKDVILKKSFPVLESVGGALKASPQIKKIRVEGHTDNKGKPEYNRDLSDRRAKSVMRYLIEKDGIDPGRLEAKGFGPDRPIADNGTKKGRDKNRRVDFVIVDPPQPEGVQTKSAAQVEAPSSPDKADKKDQAADDKADKKRRSRRSKDKAEGDKAEGDKAEGDKADGAAKKERKHRSRSKKDEKKE